MQASPKKKKKKKCFRNVFGRLGGLGSLKVESRPRPRTCSKTRSRPIARLRLCTF